MPKLSVEGFGTYDVDEGKRLVKALIEDVGADQLHACGGVSKCTTCRVRFVAGEPSQMTQAEKETLTVREVNQPGVRLSCQIRCESDMSVELISRLEGSGRKDQGSAVADEIQPDPVWVEKG